MHHALPLFINVLRGDNAGASVMLTKGHRSTHSSTWFGICVISQISILLSRNHMESSLGIIPNFLHLKKIVRAPLLARMPNKLLKLEANDVISGNLPSTPLALSAVSSEPTHLPYTCHRSGRSQPEFHSSLMFFPCRENLSKASRTFRARTHKQICPHHRPLPA